MNFRVTYVTLFEARGILFVSWLTIFSNLSVFIFIYHKYYSNFVYLQVPEDEVEARKKIIDGLTDGASKEQVDRFEKELKEQENLLAGYQQENKKLYDQLKSQQKQSKQAEERMFKENQKLSVEVANLRYQYFYSF